MCYAVDISLEMPAREATEYALMEAGALGTETNDEERGLLRITAYFNEVPDRERLQTELAEALRIYHLPTSSVGDMSVRKVPDRDWLAEWKKSWQPVNVGERFVIAPPWTEIAGARNRFVIHIEPAMAFGTGTHETTQLCLSMIEKYFAGGSFLDVGTGTGILAIAAAMLFPEARIEACDTDADAVAIARDNAKLNGIAQISFRVGTIDETTASANCVCANLTADAVSELLPQLLAVTCGRLILSGILNSQLETILGRLQELGIAEPLEINSAGEWVALAV